MTTRDVLVVGGGIGGLVLARALARAGIAVTVIERAPSLRALGAGITLGANAMRVLASLGLADAVAARGRALQRAVITDAAGRELSASDLDALAPRLGHGYAIARGALHEVLADGLAAAGVTVRCGAEVTALDDDPGGVIATGHDGTRARYHAVVGADGLRSSVRALWFGAVEPRYAGYTCWRWTGPVRGGLDRAIEAWGRGLRVGLVPLPGDHVYAFLVANAPRGTPADPRQAAVALARERFAGFGGEVARVLAAMDESTPLLHHDIEEIEVSPWCRGAVGLLGDAAHAMTPNYGQGAAMAIEDAIVLARELVAHDAAAAALGAYEARRRPRVDALQRGARRFGKLAQTSSRVGAWARDLAVRWTPASTTARALETILAHVA